MKIKNYFYNIRLIFIFLCISIHANDVSKLALDKGQFLYDFVEYHLIDSARQELYPNDGTHPYRELMIHVWFPTQEETLYPLLIFSHGLGGQFNGMSYMYLCEFLASQGYVVVSISHAYACKSVIFPDGRVTKYCFPVPSLHCLYPGDIYSVEIETWIADMRFVLDICEQYSCKAGSPLYKKCDMSRIGLLGHSFGGATAVQVCRRDSRVKAAINLDGPLYGCCATNPFFKPVMFIVGLLDVCGFDYTIPEMRKAFLWSWYINKTLLPMIDLFISGMSSDVYKIMIHNCIHDMFSDNALMSSCLLKQFVRDGHEMHEAICLYVRGFFDSYLKEKNWNLNYCFPGVTIEMK